jgi:nucleotide-binding universal stress UspA family protein
VDRGGAALSLGHQQSRVSDRIAVIERAVAALGEDRLDTDLRADAARWAAGELTAGGKLVVVYACRAQHMPPTPLSSSGERHDEGRAILDELMLDGDPALFDIELETEVSDRDPAAALIDAAHRHRARAIVLGVKPHSRLHEALGTVTTELLTELLRSSRCPSSPAAERRAERRGAAHAVRRRQHF